MKWWVVTEVGAPSSPAITGVGGVWIGAPSYRSTFNMSLQLWPWACQAGLASMFLRTARNPRVMENLMCQIYWGTGSPNTQSNIFSGCVCECSWMKWTFKLLDWVEQIALLSVGGPNIIRLGIFLGLKAWAQHQSSPLTDWDLHHWHYGSQNCITNIPEFSVGNSRLWN